MKTVNLKKLLIDKSLIIVLLLMIVGMIIIEPSFLQWRVFTDILTQSAVKMICALGLMFPLLLGGTDLSGGRQVGLAAVLVASMSQMMDYSNRFWPKSSLSSDYRADSCYTGGCGSDRSGQWIHDCKIENASVHRYIRHVHDSIWYQLPVFFKRAE